jgi:sn-glycerol 3-phosphate transport system substrate-binding protein
VAAVAAAVALALVAAACGGGGGGGGGGGASGKLPRCPLAALKDADTPVEVVVWHGLNEALLPAFTPLVDEFNRSQSDVKVTLVAQGGYDDVLEKFKAGLRSGDLPDLMQLEDTATQLVADTQAVFPAQACMEADGFERADLLERIVSYYSVDDVLLPAYFNVSNPILYYDKAAYERAGLDPETPPATLEEVKEYSEKLVAAGYPHGYALKTDPWILEQWSAKGGVTYVNNGNGRRARATAVTWDNKVAEGIFTWIKDMVDRGLAVTNPDQGQNAINNFLAVRNGEAAMTVDTSAALGRVTEVIETGQGGSVRLGVGPMPGPVGKGGVLVGGGAWYLSKKSSPAKIAAAWKFAKFLLEPRNVAFFSAGTGYLPIRKAALDEPVLTERWAKYPGFRVAYEQLVQGVENDATAGPLLGDYVGVRNVVRNAIQSMLTQGKAPKAALADAAREADKVIAEYNQRIGG